MFNACRQLGGAIGVAFLTTVLAAVGPTRLSAGHVVANLTAYHVAFLAAAGVALVAVLTTFTVTDGDAVATMVRRGRSASRAAAKTPVAAEVG